MIAWLIFIPKAAYAMDVDFHFTATQEQWISEIWYDHNLFWQITFCPDGVIPVSTNNAKYRTLIVPDFENGLFTLSIR